MKAWLAAGLGFAVGAVAVGGLSIMSARSGWRTSPKSPMTQGVQSAPRGSASTPDSNVGLLGVVLAQETVTITSRYESRIRSIGVDLGARVKKGDILVRMDTTAVERELHTAEAVLATAIAEERRAGIELERAGELARSRTQPGAAGVFSGEEQREAMFRRKQAEPTLAMAQSRVVEQRRRLEQLRVQVQEADLRAPFDGLVAARMLHPGAMAAPGVAILRIVSEGKYRVRFAVQPEHAGMFAVGTRVQVEVDKNTKQTPATVERIAPEVDAASRMLFVEATFLAQEETKASHAGRPARVYRAEPAAP